MSVSIDLHDKVALVTGGTRNIGIGIARLLAEAGCSVAVFGGSNEESLTRAVADVRDTGSNGFGALVDLTVPSQIDLGVEEVVDRLGPIDILVNNAASRPHLTLAEATAEEWDAIFNLNLRAPFLLARKILPTMLLKGAGRIINISGIDAFWGGRDKAHVVASKAGLLGLTRALAVECEGTDVTVNAIVPGPIDTTLSVPGSELSLRKQQILERVPMGRLGRIEEVASACLFLASDLSSYITGQSLVVSGGAFPTLRPISRHAEDSQ